MNTETIESILKFRDARDWKQFHNSKDLAISLSIESSELLENFQWKTSDEAVKTRLPEISDELADVLIYAALLADSLGLDMDKIVREKIQKNSQKYPVEKACGSNKKYSEL